MVKVPEQLSVVTLQTKRAGESFMVYCNTEELKQWLKKHDSVRLLDVVSTEDIFLCVPGSPLPNRASHQEIENFFGTSDVNTALQMILEKGEVKHPRHGFEHSERTAQTTTHSVQITH